MTRVQHGRTAWPRALVLAVGFFAALGAIPLHAQSQDGAGVGEGDATQRALEVELRFRDRSVELVGTRSIEAYVPQQFGTPQLEPLFFEIYGEGSETLYAASLGDPRDVHKEHLEAPASSAPGNGATAPAHDTVRVLIPDLPEARQIAVSRRVPSNAPGSTAGERESLLLAPLNGGR